MWSSLFSRAKSRRPFPRERLTIRILANVNDVDPQDDVSASSASASPPIVFAEDWFLSNVTAQLCLNGDHGTLQWLTEADIASWGLSLDELFEIALANLNDRSATAQLNKLTVDGVSVWSPICEGVTLSSLILADRLLADFGFDREDVVAVLPNRDTYYFGKRSSTGSIELLQWICGKAWEDEDCPRKYRITTELLAPDRNARFGWAVLPS